MSRKQIAVGLGAVWAIMTLWAVAGGVGGLRGRLADAWAPPERVAALQDGDPAYHAFLERTLALAGGAPGLLLLVHDPAGQDLFFTFRAQFRLAPQPVWATLSGRLPSGSGEASVRVDPRLADLVERKGISRAAYFDRLDPGRNRWMTVRAVPGARLAFGPLPGPWPAPLSPRPRPLRWFIGLALLAVFGRALLAAARLDTAVGDHPAACWSLAFVLGAGLTGWMLEALSICGVPWSAVAVAWCWSPVLALAAVGRTTRHAEPLAVRPAGRRVDRSAATARRPPPYRVSGLLGMAGTVLLAAAIAVLLVRVWIPAPARETWDGWAEFGIKAKMALTVRGVPWTFLESPQYDFAMPRYAIGLPSVQAWLAQMAGGMDERLLLWLPLMHGVALLGLLAALLADAGAGAWAPLLCGLFGSLPVFQRWAVSGYQDVPVAAAMTGSLWLLLRARRGLVPVWSVGLVMGAGAMIKNEGAVWGCGVLLVMGHDVLTGRAPARGLAAALLVFALMAAPWRVETRRLHGVSKDYVVQPGRMAAGLPERLPVILRAVLYEGWEGGASDARLRVADPGGPREWWEHLAASWNVFWYAIVVALILDRRALLRPPAAAIVVLLLVMAAAYGSAFLASTWEMSAHLSGSIDRLMLQVAPILLALAVLVTVRPGGQAARTGRVGVRTARR